jgi:hypothetical protein
MNTAVCSMTVTVTVRACVRSCVRACVRGWRTRRLGARCECRCADCAVPLCGADLVVRQMEDAAQQQFSPPGTHCKFLSFDPKSNAAFVVHMDSDGMPVRRTTEILQRSYQESEVAFNIDPGNMVTLADYECLAENKPESENDSPLPIEQLDFSTIDVDPSDLAMRQDAQRFMSGRRKFLHRRGDLSSMEIENLISREWRRRAGRQLQKSYIPVDKVAYQEALLRGLQQR